MTSVPGYPHITISDYDPDEAFASRFGLPKGADLEAEQAWKATMLPADRRAAARYMSSVQGYVCPICKQTIDLATELDRRHPGRIEIDHIRPSARGGPDTWGNTRATHASCNHERNDNTLPRLTPVWAAKLLELQTLRHTRQIVENQVIRARVAQYRLEARLVMENPWHRSQTVRPDEDPRVQSKYWLELARYWEMRLP